MRRNEGVQINGQRVPWVAGEEDDELKPLTAGCVPFPVIVKLDQLMGVDVDLMRHLSWYLTLMR